MCDNISCPLIDFDKEIELLSLDEISQNILREPSDSEIKRAIASLCSLIRPAIMSSAAESQKQQP